MDRCQTLPPYFSPFLREIATVVWQTLVGFLAQPSWREGTLMPECNMGLVCTLQNPASSCGGLGCVFLSVSVFVCVCVNHSVSLSACLFVGLSVNSRATWMNCNGAWLQWNPHVSPFSAYAHICSRPAGVLPRSFHMFVIVLLFGGGFLMNDIRLMDCW